MNLDRDSVSFRILERLCSMPRAVRGVTGTKLEAEFNAGDALEELAAAGLITRRGWHDGPPGAVWIPTKKGEAAYREVTDREQSTSGSTPF